MIKLLPGELINIDINKCVSPENLTILATENDKYRLYETVNLDSFPGWNDFKGHNKLFKNETLIIIGKKGRPISFSKKEKWNLYDVYFVMYANKVYECFAYCIKKISDEQP